MVADFATVLGFACFITARLLTFLPASTTPLLKNNQAVVFLIHSFYFLCQRSPRSAWIFAWQDLHKEIKLLLSCVPPSVKGTL
jgi:hypothetical protein